MSDYDSIDDYISRTCMEQDGKWGTNVEMAVLAHLLNFYIPSFDLLVVPIPSGMVTISGPLLFSLKST